MTGLLELLFLTGQALVLATLPYFLYLVIRFGVSSWIPASGAPSDPPRDQPSAAEEPAADHDEHPAPGEIAHA